MAKKYRFLDKVLQISREQKNFLKMLGDHMFLKMMAGVLRLVRSLTSLRF